MINTQYKLTMPFLIESFCRNVDIGDEDVIVRPEMLSICKADMRYYFGMRDAKVLKQRLPLALIHEACGTVLRDNTGQFQIGESVILLPNIPGIDKKIGENYRLDSRFRSSRADGFMQEVVKLPASQIVSYKGIQKETAAMTEFVSVGVHAVTSFLKKVKHEPQCLGVWGDGSLGYVICALLRSYLPKTKITVIGVNKAKLQMFRFADECLTVDELGDDVRFDDTFECVGGSASGTAIAQMIDTISPEGMITLLGVSEEYVPINTRMVLEKGLTILGRSRSSREDFEKAVELLETDTKLANRMSMLVSEVIKIQNISDMHHAFQQSKIVDYKLMMDWKI